MTEAEIEALIFTHEHAAALGKDRGPSHAKAVKFHRDTASALRFLLKEREDLIQATAAKDLAQCDQLHAAEWQTIDTAPKDGTAILLWWRYCPEASVGRWDAGYGDEDDTRYVCHPQGWICDDDDCIPKNQHDCTHWMPLPSPPQRQGDRPELPNDLRSRETKTGENP